MVHHLEISHDNYDIELIHALARSWRDFFQAHELELDCDYDIAGLQRARFWQMNPIIESNRG
jgi:hypothetical protein